MISGHPGHWNHYSQLASVWSAVIILVTGITVLRFRQGKSQNTRYSRQLAKLCVDKKKLIAWSNDIFKTEIEGLSLIIKLCMVFFLLLKIISDLRSPETCRLENILTVPPFSFTLSTRRTYLCLVGMSADLHVWTRAQQEYVCVCVCVCVAYVYVREPIVGSNKCLSILT